MNCIAIDDNPLMLRKLEAFIEEIDWLTIDATFDNSIKGATAIFEMNPDLVLLDIEMPNVDGHYLVDWVAPKLKEMETPPKIIIISSLDVAKEDQLSGVAGYINKSKVISVESLNTMLRAIIFD